MVLVRSVRTFTSTEAGRPASIWGSDSLIESTTWITLAPGWRWTLSSTAGVLLAQLESLAFSRALDHSRDVATGCTGAPFL